MPSQQTQAFWITAAGRGEFRTELLPEAGPGQVRVRTLYSAISRGTESLVFDGRIPPSEYERMRAPFQAGDFPFPVKYGYANVGLVEAGEPSLLGQMVFCLHPHQQDYVVPSAAVLPVPDDTPAARAILAANMETAINALWDSNATVGERIAVIGAGVIGSLVGALASQLPGAEVWLVDIDPRRATLAEGLGCRFALPEAAPCDCDRVFHASGQPDGLRRALEIAAQDARVIELSWYGDKTVSLPLGESFHARRLTLQSSQVGHLPPAQRPRWTHRRRLALALQMLADPRFDRLITGESSFTGLPATMRRLARDPQGALCERIRYFES